MYVSMYVLFCHAMYGCFECVLYAYICMYLCICILVCVYVCMCTYMLKSMYVLAGRGRGGGGGVSEGCCCDLNKKSTRGMCHFLV